MTPGAIRRLCQRLADTVDPDGARERRERKERDEARVAFYRSHGGAGAMYACGLPPDEALKSQANIQKRALEYKKAGIGEKMDFLRVLALVDLLNGTGVPARLALWQDEQAGRQRAGAGDPGKRAGEGEQRRNEARRRHGDDPDAGQPPFPEDQPPFPDAEPGGIDDRDDACSRDDAGSDRGNDGRDHGSGSGSEDDGPGDGPAGGDAGTREDRGPEDEGQGDAGDDPGDGDGPRGGGSGPRGGGSGPGSGGAAGGPVPAGMPDPGLPTLANMTYPLATVLGEADRPGEAAGYGSLDPALVRKLADAAAQSPRSRWCITFTVIFSFCVSRGCDLRCPVVDSVPDGTLAVW